MLFTVRCILVAVSIIGFVFVLVKPDDLIIELVVLGIGLLIVFVDLIWSDAIYRRVANQGTRLRWPWRSLAWLIGTVLLFLLFAYPTSYNVTYPGLTMAMNRYAHVEGGKPEGKD